MKATTTPDLSTTKSILLLLFLFGFSLASAQTGFILSWDSEVGCLEYNGKGRAPIEQIAEDGDCLLTCEGSTVTFTLTFGDEPVSFLDWTTDGGHILDTNFASSKGTAEIKWPHVHDHGNVTVDITLNNGNEIQRSLCVTTKPKPQGGFEILGQNSAHFCSENTLFFENNAFVPDGSQIVASHWDFGDGSYSNDKDPSHVYHQSGNYEISLTVYDECGCSNTWKKRITVAGPGLEISCPTVVCEGTMETYSVESLTNQPVHCSRYNWHVDGGHIIQQGNDWVSVVWDNVDEDGFGYIYFDQSYCNLGCDNLLVAKIPVITSKGTIKGGKTELCQGEQSRYALPRWPTTDIDWQVVDANAPNTPIAGATELIDQRNEIAVDATNLPPGDYILKASYINTLLNCGGIAEFEFSVLKDLEIDTAATPDEICQGDGADFQLSQTVPGVTWTISKENQTVATLPGSGSQSQANYQFTAPGHYTIAASANNYCTDYIEIDVVEIPDIGHAHISGPTEICPGIGQDYIFTGSTGGFDVQWTVDQGEFSGPDVGGSVTIIFDENHTDYEVTAQLVHPDFNGCQSDPITLHLHQFEPEAEIQKTMGGNFICSSSMASFEVTGYSDPDYFEWSVEPEQLAHISGGQGSSDVDVVFNEPYQNQTQGVIKVQAKVCGKMKEIATYDFDLVPHPVLTIENAPGKTCPEDPFTITVSSDPPVPASAIEIDFENVTLPISPTISQIGQGTYKIQNIILPNADPNNPVNVNYTITAGGSGLCGTGEVSGSIDRSPAPIIQVFQSGANTFCDAADIETTITANIQGSSVSINDMEWYYSPNGVGVSPVQQLFPSPSTPNELHYGTQNPAPGFGYYWVEATNSFWCTTISNPFRIKKDCTTPIPPCNNETVDINGEWTDCSEITLTAHYTGNPVSVNFYKTSGFTAEYAHFLSSTDTNNTLTQQFETDASGTYIFGVIADYGTCVVSEPVHVQVDYKVQLNKKVHCAANNYQVTTLNQSTYLAGSAPQVDYTFKKLPNGPVILPDSENDNEAIASLGNGDYMLTLTLSSPGKPTCEETQTLHLQKPDASFSLDNKTCAEDAVHLFRTNPTPGATYDWEFQGAHNSQDDFWVNLNQPLGNSPVEVILTVTDANGCTDSKSHTISVNQANFNGFIKADPTTDLCEGDATDLSYVNDINDDNVAAYQWYKDNQELTGETNSSLTNVSEPGEYALYLFDEDGCRDATVQSVFVNRIRPPHLAVEITGSVCKGEDVKLSGTLTPGNAEYQISRQKNNSGFIVVQTWTTGPQVDYTDANPGVGDYQYRISYRASQTGCADEQVFEATVHPAPTVSVQVQSVQCDPYRVELSATGNQSGTYIWSNGMSGPHITVDHGGAYLVRFKPDGADCEAEQQITAPKSPEEFAWVFPTGCYDYCPEKSGTDSYIIGPLPYFPGGYAYDLDGNPQNSAGSGTVPDFELSTQKGALDLTLGNGDCDFTTDELQLSTSPACGKPCDVDFIIKNSTLIQKEPFVLYAINGGIQNNYNFDISIDLYSPDGIFNPGNVYIPANALYDFAAHNMVFMPYNPNNTGVNVEYTITIHDHGQHEIICNDQIQFKLPKPKTASSQKRGFAEMQVVPNPVETTTTVYYDLQKTEAVGGNAHIDLYGLQGNLISTHKIDQLKSAQRFDLSRQPAGTYFIVVYHKDRPIGQQILIKK